MKQALGVVPSIAVVFLGACQAAPPSQSSRPPIVIVSIDTLRADHLPAYGYPRGETPAIDGLREESILFTQAFSAVPLTLPSHVSLLSGVAPLLHRVRDNLGFRLAADLSPWLPQALAQRGYRGGGFVSSYVLRAATGFGRGFERFDDDIPWRRDRPLGGLQRSGEETVRRALDWLREADPASRPPFLLLHLYEPHAPYTPPEPFASRFRDRPYDGEIAAADAAVGRLLAGLRQLDLYEPALIVLTADHGEGLGDHGESEHGVFLYREALQVPLLLKLPRSARGGATVAARVGLIDIAPTILELTGAAKPDQSRSGSDAGSAEATSGRSLLSTATAGRRGARELYAESHYGRLHYGWSALTSLFADSYQYIEAPRPELYALDDDPAERRDLADEERRVRAVLQRRLGELTATEPDAEAAARESVSAEERDRLAALGYLSLRRADSGPAAVGAPPRVVDPKDGIRSLAALQEAFRLFFERRFADAVPFFELAVAEHPGAVDGWDYLGRSLQATRRWEQAAKAYERAEELAAGDPQFALARAAVELEGGRFETASATLGTVLRERRLRRLERIDGKFVDSEIVRDLILRLADASPRAAERFAEEATSDLVESAARHEIEAWLHLRRRDWAAAERASRRALELDPGRLVAGNQRGVALRQLGDARGAMEVWRDVAEQHPEAWDVLYNLGVTAGDLGEEALAREAFGRFLALAPAERYRTDLAQVRRWLAALDRKAALPPAAEVSAR